MSRAAGPAATIAAASGWIGLTLIFFWQEFAAEKKPDIVWWFRIPATLALGLVILVFAIECLVAEMTVRRWALSVLVFGVFGALLLLSGIFNPGILHLHRAVLIPLGLFYLGAAALAGAGAKDSL